MNDEMGETCSTQGDMSNFPWRNCYQRTRM